MTYLETYKRLSAEATPGPWRRKMTALGVHTATLIGRDKPDDEDYSDDELVGVITGELRRGPEDANLITFLHNNADAVAKVINAVSVHRNAAKNHSPQCACDPCCAADEELESALAALDAGSEAP